MQDLKVLSATLRPPKPCTAGERRALLVAEAKAKFHARRTHDSVQHLSEEVSHTCPVFAIIHDASSRSTLSVYFLEVVIIVICGWQVRKLRVDLGTALQAYEQPRSFIAKSALLANTSAGAPQSIDKWEREMEEAVAAADANQQTARAALADAYRHVYIMHCSCSQIDHAHTCCCSLQSSQNMLPYLGRGEHSRAQSYPHCRDMAQDLNSTTGKYG